MAFLRKILLTCLMIAAFSVESRAVIVQTPLYVYGFSATFNDSTVYITDIMVLDSAWMDTKSKFLYGRPSYSYQLKNYLIGQGVENPTTIISFATTRKKAEKKYLKLKKKYLKEKGAYTIKYIAETDFEFSCISAEDDPSAVKGTTKAERKAAKKAAKEAKEAEKAEKEAKKAAGQGQQRKGPGQGGRPSGPPPGGGGMGGGMGGM